MAGRLGRQGPHGKEGPPADVVDHAFLVWYSETKTNCGQLDRSDREFRFIQAPFQSMMALGGKYDG